MREGDKFKINGLTEYGYGLWTRWAWNSYKGKLITKPTWTALARLTMVENYEGDARAHGDRTLANWVGPGYYHFTSYSLNPANTNHWNNVNY